MLLFCDNVNKLYNFIAEHLYYTFAEIIIKTLNGMSISDDGACYEVKSLTGIVCEH